MTTVKDTYALWITAKNDASGALRQFGNDAERETTRAGNAIKQYRSQALAVGAATLATAGAAGLAVIKSTTDSYAGTVREAIKLQRVLGGSSEDASRLAFAARQSGLTVDQLSTAMVRLSKAAGTGTGQSALAKLGIDSLDVNGKAKPTAQLIGDIAEQISRLDNGRDKNRIVTALFGRGGAELLPLLNRGRQGIADLAAEADKLGLTVTDRDVSKVRELTKAQRDLAAAKRGLSTQVGREVAPAVTEAEAAVARLATGAVEKLSHIPDSIKRTAAEVAVIGSAGATGLGAVGTTAFALNQTAGAADLIKNRLRNADGTLSNMAVGTGAITVATLAWGTALGELNRQYHEGLDLLTESKSQIEAAFDPQHPNRFATSTMAAAKALSRTDYSEPLNALDKIEKRIGIGKFNLYDTTFGGLFRSKDQANRSAAAKDQFDEIKSALRGMNEEAGRRYLDNVSRDLQSLGFSADRTKNLLGPLYQQLADQASADRASGAINRYSDAVDQAGDSSAAAAPKLDPLAYGFKRTTDEAGRSVSMLEKYSSDVSSMLTPILDLADANDRLKDAQKRQSEALTSNSPAVISAYQNLARAEQNLQDVMKEGSDQLQQISPEEQIRRARARLEETNARLAANPKDSAALTQKDEALADMESAARRRQDLKRSATERAKSLRDARQQVSDAQKAYDDAKAQTGPQSQAFTAAGRDVARAQLDVGNAATHLAQLVLDHKISLEELHKILKDWYDQGILTKQGMEDLGDQVDSLVDQALDAAKRAGYGADGIFGGILAKWFGDGKNQGIFGGMYSQWFGQAATVSPPAGYANPWGGAGRPTIAGLPIAGGHASGGLASAGELYRVNERTGPAEYFRPFTTGMVYATPLGAAPPTSSPRPLPTPQMRTSGSGVGPATVTEQHEHLHLHEVVQPATAVDIYTRERRKKAYLFGTGTGTPRR